ncbi:MAG: NAD(P)/FAD-dependent oxidoreductase [Hyphomicrobiales bacterium]
MTRPSDSLSYYRASANPHAGHPRLEGEHEADVCVIGAGFTGLSAALELAERGFSVAVLEAETVGWGASGRNGGQICTGFSSGMEKLEAQAGKDDARKCWALSEEAKTLMRSRIERYGIQCDLKWGYVHVAPKAGGLPELLEMQEGYAAYGYDKTEVLDKAALEDRLGSTIYHGGLRDAGAGHLHPLNYCLGLADAAVSHGARIFEHSAVTRVETDASPAAHTAGGVVRAKFIVIAGNAYLGKTVPALYPRIMPVGSFILATEPLGENRARSLIRDDDAICDTNFVVDYFRLSGDRRMLFGGRCSYSTVEPRDLQGFMRPRMLKVFPQLDDVKLDYCWGGYIGITVNRIPDIGRLSDTVYYAHGYSGQGVALTGIYGKVIAEAVAGQAERFDVLSQFKHTPFPGGPIRTPMLVAAMLYYRMRDLLG